MPRGDFRISRRVFRKLLRAHARRIKEQTGAVKRALRTSLALPFLDPAVCRITNDERRQAQRGRR
jgi:hypothetical protein